MRHVLEIRQRTAKGPKRSPATTDRGPSRSIDKLKTQPRYRRRVGKPKRPPHQWHEPGLGSSRSQARHEPLVHTFEQKHESISYGCFTATESRSIGEEPEDIVNRQRPSLANGLLLLWFARQEQLGGNFVLPTGEGANGLMPRDCT